MVCFRTLVLTHFIPSIRYQSHLEVWLISPFFLSSSDHPKYSSTYISQLRPSHLTLPQITIFTFIELLFMFSHIANYMPTSFKLRSITIIPSKPTSPSYLLLHQTTPITLTSSSLHTTSNTSLITSSPFDNFR